MERLLALRYLLTLTCIVHSCPISAIEAIDIAETIAQGDKVSSLAIVIDDTRATRAGFAIDTKSKRMYLVGRRGEYCEVKGTSAPAPLQKLEPVVGQTLSRQPIEARKILDGLLAAVRSSCFYARRICSASGCVIFSLNDLASENGTVVFEEGVRTIDVHRIEPQLLSESASDELMMPIAGVLSNGTCGTKAIRTLKIEALGRNGAVIRDGASWWFQPASVMSAASCRLLYSPQQAAEVFAKRADREFIAKSIASSLHSDTISNLYQMAAMGGEKWRTYLRVDPAIVFWNLQ